ncbi:MAG: Glucosyltransferase-like protein [Pycnora praestabilis]|nr:MAG: Glucosyltransferase-like protein [Pycnora praestabilis]
MAPSSSLHKPRKKKKGSPSSASAVRHGTIITDAKTNAQKPAFPLVSFLWPARGATSEWIVLPLILMVVGLFRWTVGLWSYSGLNSPPMHGDFEAQRHWMEITSQLPISQWYFYDLEWWGLDYPPLTAYHSWVLGKIGSFIEPKWFALDTSRGLDDPHLKIYMRATVVISEFLTYVPAAIIFLRRFSRLRGVHPWDAYIALVAVLMQPATILIDHAHFQYNTVMLGFVLASMSSMLAGRLLWGCIFFVAALSFKQMALYYAPAIFSFLLGMCIIPRFNISRFISIAVITTLAFAITFAPLLLGALYDSYRGVTTNPGKGSFDSPPLMTILPFKTDEKSWYFPPLLQLTQTIHRIFPFARGLFEDKVANLWCALHIIHKLHRYPTALLQRLSLVATLAAITPPSIILFVRPRKELLPLGLATTAWGFYLCSFQVHEKSVLLPLLPMTMLLGADGGLTPDIRAWVGWANMLGVWTMFPLLQRDQLRVPYFVLSLLWAYLLGLLPTSITDVKHWIIADTAKKEGRALDRSIHQVYYSAMVLWHILEAFVDPPSRKPDLWVVLNVAIGVQGFVICYLWCLWQLVVESGFWSDWRSRGAGTGKEGKQQVSKKKQ